MLKRIVWLAILIVAVAGAATAAAALLKPARIAARIATGTAPCSENGGLGLPLGQQLRRRDGRAGRSGDEPGHRLGSRSAHSRAASRSAPTRSGSTATAPGNVERVDPQTKQVVARIPIGPSLWDVEFGAGAVWATSEFNGTVAASTRRRTRIVATIKVGHGAAAGPLRRGRDLGRRATPGKSIYRVDPATNRARAVPVGLLSPDSSPSATPRSG